MNRQFCQQFAEFFRLLPRWVILLLLFLLLGRFIMPLLFHLLS